MKQFTKPKLLNHCIILILLGSVASLSACTGGDFGVAHTPKPAPSTKPTEVVDKAQQEKIKKQEEQSKKVAEQNKEVSDTLKSPALGYVLEGAKNDDPNNKEKISLKEENLKALGEVPTLVTDKLTRSKQNLPNRLLQGLATPSFDVGNNGERLNTDNLWLVGYGNLDTIDKPHHFKRPQVDANVGGYQHVLFGTLTDKSNQTNKEEVSPIVPLSYAFYYGTNPSAIVPAAKVSYEGHWLYMSDAKSAETQAKLKDDLKDDDYSNKKDDAPSYPSSITLYNEKLNGKTTKQKLEEGMKATFEADFGEKKLTGKLYRTEEQKKSDKPTYDINADIKNNRFVGTASSKVGDNTQADDAFEKELFSTGGTVEGGFYGKNAAELAGKMVTDNKDLMAVFGAKRTDDATKTDKDVKTLFDAVALNSPTETKVKAKDVFVVDDEGGIDDLPSDIYQFSKKDVEFLKRDKSELWEKLKKMTPDFEEVLEKVMSGSAFNFGETADEDADDGVDWEEKEEELFNKYEEFLNKYKESDKGSVLSKVESKTLPFFGDVGKLRVGNHYYDLTATDPTKVTDHQVPNTIEIKTDHGIKKMILAKTGDTVTQYVYSCCDDLKHVKFGQYKLSDNDSTSYFVQGLRSDTIPQSGEATYKGHWMGFIELLRPRKDGDNSSGLTMLNKHSVDVGTATFTANFDKKTLDGKFLSGTQHVFDFVNVVIDGTGFKGKAKTKDSFTFNHQSTGAKDSITFEADVQGGFYGVDGAELGGTVSHNNNDGNTKTDYNQNNVRVGVVFGAKRDGLVKKVEKEKEK